MQDQIPNIIIVSGYFSGDINIQKLRYLEKIDAFIRRKGLKLLLINYGSVRPVTVCDCIVFRKHALHSLYIHKILSTPEMEQSVSIEAETLGLSLEEAELKIKQFGSFMHNLFLKKNIALCIMWNQFNGYHNILTSICKHLSIPFLYTEYGIIPGTINFDKKGQMAESWVTQDHKEFMDLPVDDSDLSRTQKFIEYLRKNKKSRKPQNIKHTIDQLIQFNRDRGRKIIFYAGQNDWAAGMLPRKFPDAVTHSPFYKDTIDALDHLSVIAEKNDWHILFKPHPMVENRHKDFKISFPDRVDAVIGANIFECMKKSDITATILSQVSYLALIHERPCIMLGRNQLYGKCCTYQPESRSQVENTLKEGLEKGFTQELKKFWLRHAAQVCKYYVFSFEEDIVQFIGRDIGETAQYILDQTQQHSPKSLVTAYRKVAYSFSYYLRRIQFFCFKAIR